jgi:PAS domain S-box-containing protein
VLARYALNAFVGTEARSLPFFLAVLATAWWGGLRPGLVAATLGVLAATLLFVERTGIVFRHPGDYLRLVSLLTIGGLTSWLFEVVHRSRRRLLDQQEALRASHQRLLHFITSAPAALAMFDRQMRYLAASRRWLNDYGLEGRDVVGRSCYDFYPALPGLWREAHQRGLAGESSSSEGDRYDHPDGSSQWVRWEVQPWHTCGGEVGGIVISSEDITERKRAEAALREGEARYRRMLESLPVGVFVHDGERMFYANPKALQIVGARDAEALSGIAPLDLVAPECREMARRRIDAMLRRGEILPPVDAKVQRLDGSLADVEVSSRPIRFADRDCVQVHFLDVTERNRAAAELWKSHRLLETISRVQAEFLVQADVQQVFGQMLATLLEVTGSEYGVIGEVLRKEDGQPYLKTHVITDIAWDEASRDFFQQQAASGLEFTNLGSLFGAVLTSAAVVISNDPANDPRSGGLPAGHPPLRAFLGLPILRAGELIGMAGVANRPGGYGEAIARELVSLLHTCGSLIEAVRIERQRKQAEERVLASQRMLESVLNNIPQGVFWKDRQSRYLGGNAVVCRAFGVEGPEQLFGKADRDLAGLTKEQAAFFVLKDQEVMASGRPIYSILEQATLADGSTIWMETNKVPMRDCRGEVVGVLGTWQDVTERRGLEEQLRQSQKMEAVGQLAGGIAHDFNNLLTVINGHSELLLSGLPDGHPMRQDLELIHNAGERAASLTNQLLAFSRKQVLQPRLVDLNALIRESEKMLRRVIREDIRLVVRCCPDPARVKADPGQVSQVLLNLSLNACDAMAEGGELLIETSLAEVDEAQGNRPPEIGPGRYVVLTVRDTGCGMSPEVRERIFEPFFTTKGLGKGTGLGLAMVHGVVKQSGGHIDVSTEPGQGTTFLVYLPAVCDETEPGSNERTRRSPQGGTETVLLVEDEEALGQFAEAALKGSGYQVLRAAGGRKALELAEAHPGIDLLVTDVVMPGMSGPQLAAALRARRPGLKVLYVSGYTPDTVLRHGISVGEAAFLQKPFGVAGLGSKVREVLDGGK